MLHAWMSHAGPPTVPQGKVEYFNFCTSFAMYLRARLHSVKLPFREPRYNHNLDFDTIFGPILFWRCDSSGLSGQ